GDRPVHERALAGAGDAGDDDQHPERDVDVDVAQVVGRRPAELHGARGGARSARGAPAGPAPGPRSTTWSAIAIVSGSCSTTSTVLPLSRSCSSRSFLRSTSGGGARRKRRGRR